MSGPERCVTCGRDAVARCDQCDVPLCTSHRTVIRTELGEWSRCPSCRLKSRITESPLVRWWVWSNQVESFFTWVWLLAVAVLGMIVVAWRLAVGPR